MKVALVLSVVWSFLALGHEHPSLKPYTGESKEDAKRRESLSHRAHLVTSTTYEAADEWDCLYEMADDIVATYFNHFIKQQRGGKPGRYARTSSLTWRVGLEGNKYWFNVEDQSGKGPNYSISFRASSGWSRAKRKYICYAFADASTPVYVSDGDDNVIAEVKRQPPAPPSRTRGGALGAGY